MITICFSSVLEQNIVKERNTSLSKLETDVSMMNWTLKAGFTVQLNMRTERKRVTFSLEGRA